MITSWPIVLISVQEMVFCFQNCFELHSLLIYAWFIKFIALQVPWIFNFHTIPKDQFILKCKGFALFNLHNLKALWIIFTLHYIKCSKEIFELPIGIQSSFIQKIFKTFLYFKNPLQLTIDGVEFRTDVPPGCTVWH